MKRVLITISYDGTAYHGWQVQPNGISVQSTVCKALFELTGKETSVTGCSRTDAGVHAKQFCFHIDCDENLPETAFLKGLNSVLPDDIRVIDCKTVNSSFHARYDCLGKTYSYGFYSGIQNPFYERYYLHLDKKPNTELMNSFCKSIIGKHDFCGFSSSKRTVTDTVRTVKECFVKEQNEFIFFNIMADGFLYNMVRILAGTALEVGYGRLSCDCAKLIFNEKERAYAGKTLPAKALFLEKVYY